MRQRMNSSTGTVTILNNGFLARRSIVRTIMITIISINVMIITVTRANLGILRLMRRRIPRQDLFTMKPTFPEKLPHRGLNYRHHIIIIRITRRGRQMTTVARRLRRGTTRNHDLNNTAGRQTNITLNRLRKITTVNAVNRNKTLQF